MKKIFYFLSLAAALTFTLVSCQKEITPHQPGEPDADNCYGVYFPAQDASGSHVYNPTQEKVIDITVARTNAKGAIEVPIKESYSEDGIFSASPIKFADGQKETTFQVRFDKAKEGVDYKASFVIDDKNYASLYNSNPIGLDFSVMCVEMKDFMTEDGSAKAMLTFSDDVFWGEVHDDVYLQYYEVDGIRYCETTGGKLLSPLDGGSTGIGPWGTDVQLKFKWYTKVQMTVGEESYDFIEVEPQYHGWDNANRNSEVWFADYYNYYQANASTPYDGDAIKFFTNNGESYPPCYYDGHGGFVFNLAYYMPTSGGYWYGFNLNAPVAVADGYLRVDYKLKAESDYSTDGYSPISIEAGIDVASIKYAVYEGELTPTQLGNKVAAIADGTDPSTKFDEFELDEEEGIKYATLLLNPETSGIYTFVAVAYDKSNKAQNSVGVVFKHIAEGDIDENKVEVNVFTEDTPARYTTYNAYDSFAYCIMGSNLVDVRVGLYTYETYQKYGLSVLCDDVKYDEEKSVSEAILEEINSDGGYYTVIGGLKPSTTYIILVWATNGSLDDFVVDIYTTDKLPYVWNSLGKGTLTDGFSVELFGRPEITVACDVYEEANTPGLYMITGYQLAHVSLFFGETEETMAAYEGGNWNYTEVVIDATDPNKVNIPEQDFGVCVNSAYGFFQIRSSQPGTLKDGVITFPANGLDCYLKGYGWLPVNEEGNFKITLPSASSSAPLSSVSCNGGLTEATIIPGSRKAVERTFERDAKPIDVKVKVSHDRSFNKALSRNADTLSDVR